MRIFVNTDGHKGIILKARVVVQPANPQAHKTTEYVVCSPYRRVYEDEGGLFVFWKKRKASVYLTAQE